MVTHLFSRNRRLAPRYPAGLDERRFRREPAPMPRMRWY
jgi:hypothetical protein